MRSRAVAGLAALVVAVAITGHVLGGRPAPPTPAPHVEVPAAVSASAIP